MRNAFILHGLVGVLLTCGPNPALANGDAPWLNPDWNRRTPFSAVPDSIEGAGTLLDITLVLDLGAPGFAPVHESADASGLDFVVTAGDGTTVLPHELVSYDPIAGTGELWFRPELFSATDNQFYLYYANTNPAAISQYASSPGDAWGNETLAVYHFEEDPSLGVLKDWGPAAADAVAAVSPTPVGPGWTSSNRVEGAVGQGWRYDGVDLWTYSTNVSSADSSFTISSWFANDPAADKGAMAFQANEARWDISYQATGGIARSDLETPNGQVSWLPDITTTDMHLYTWVMDAESDTLRFYFDGIERQMWFRYTPPGDDVSIYTGESIDTQIGIASPYAFNELDLADGIVDDYRIAEGVRTPAWVRTTYRNQHDPESFYSVLPAQTGPGATSAVGPAGPGQFGSLSVTPNPFRAVTWIELDSDSPHASVQIYDVKGRLVRTLLRPTEAGANGMRFLWDGRDGGGSRVSNGIYYLHSQAGAQSATTKVTYVR